MASQVTEWLECARAEALAHPMLNFNFNLNFNPPVKPTLPPKHFFRFPPANLPTTLPHPTESPNYDLPFNLPSDWYNALLEPAVPITFALVYATLITFLNVVNKRRNYKPWAVSKTRVFKYFVLSHNIALSLYSLWTFIGMVKALHVTIADPREYGLAGTVDSLCKMHGPRGFGSAATYNESTTTWSVTDRTIRLARDGLTPDTSDVGRLWNEGLAFYGWIFYISKFYEVIDTLIIIAKGKKSSFLQTYHHAGAMLSMWAGIRYMSPPIWLFVTANSLVHAIMYAFYTCTTVGIRIPKTLKRTLTTLQISQFVVGIAFAFGHFFVSYQIPISTSYIYHFGEQIASATSSIQSDASSALSQATATASADVASWVKKLALRAAGREGIAENVQNELGQTFGIDAVHAAQDFVRRQETRYRNDYQYVHCLDTSGQAFAVYLNIVYLIPLTGLFVQFFIKSYLKRVEERRRSSLGEIAKIASQSVQDARKGVSRRLSETFEDYQGVNGDTNGDVFGTNGKEIREDIRDIARKTQEKGQDVFETVNKKVSELDSQKVTEQVQELTKQAKIQTQETAKQVKSKTQDVVEQASKAVQEAGPSQETKDEISEKTNEITGSAKKSVDNLLSEETTSNAADTAEKVKEEAETLASKADTKLKEVVGGGKDKVKGVKEDVKKDVEETSGKSTKATEQDKDRFDEDAASDSDEFVIEPSSSPTPSKKKSKSKSKPKSPSKVQTGKSFAEAAVEGVPEKELGEVKVLDVEGEVKGNQDGDEDDSDSGPGSLTRKISDAMSSDIADGPYMTLSRSHSSTNDAETGSNLSPTPSKSRWHTKRRGKSWSSDVFGKGEPAVASSPVNVSRYQDPESPLKQDPE